MQLMDPQAQNKVKVECVESCKPIFLADQLTMGLLWKAWMKPSKLMNIVEQQAMRKLHMQLRAQMPLGSYGNYRLPRLRKRAGEEGKDMHFLDNFERIVKLQTCLPQPAGKLLNYLPSILSDRSSDCKTLGATEVYCYFTFLVIKHDENWSNYRLYGKLSLMIVSVIN